MAFGDLSAVSKQPELTYLGLCGLRYTGDGGLVVALRALQRLEELLIDCCHAPGELYCLLQHCARLRKVVLQSCQEVGLPALVSKQGMQAAGADERCG
jgi:hypothetical protein